MSAASKVIDPNFKGNVPNVNATLLNDAGGMAPSWYNAILMLFNRTGGQAGSNAVAEVSDINAAQTLAAVTGASAVHEAPPLMPVTVTASPFTYQAPYSGWVNIHAGTISATTFSRDGGATQIAVTGNIIPVSTGDQVKITYSVAPTMIMVGSE